MRFFLESIPVYASRLPIHVTRRKSTSIFPLFFDSYTDRQMSFRQGNFSTIPNYIRRGIIIVLQLIEQKNTPSPFIVYNTWNSSSCSLQNFITMHCTFNSQTLTFLFHQIDAQYSLIKNWHLLLAPKGFQHFTKY